ncbi:Parkinson disease protein 7 homolog [Dermacentor silvarum]|uniref:Parkinson disease protein 7 homolog n=1 Tax=Dermacentor silvarum TaxID=543639 RepID=UPI00189B983F|nr:Parkinson disease protein 7 homolog [Dermacentor silvarum]
MLSRCVCVFSRRRQNYSNLSMAKKALLILAEGAEEMEAVIAADVLRRAGVDVNIAGLTGASPVKCSRNVVVVPDMSLEDATLQAPYDVIVLPGGLKGAESLAASPAVGKLLKEQEKSGRLVAAICAAPIALMSHGIGQGKHVTSHPSKKEDISKGDYKYCEDRVVIDGQLITSRGPGTAFEFALAIVEKLENKAAAEKLIPPMLVKV